MEIHPPSSDDKNIYPKKNTHQRIKAFAWGISLFLWGMNLFAGLMFFQLLLVILVPKWPEVFFSVSEKIKLVENYLFYLFDFMMLIGLMLGSILPKESNTRKWIYWALSTFIFFTAMKVGVYFGDFPEGFLQSNNFTIYLIAIFYTKFLASVCKWQASRFPTTEMEPVSSNPKEWNNLQKRFQRLFRYEILLPVIFIIISFLLPLALGTIFIFLPISIFGAFIWISFLPVLFGPVYVLFLLLRFSRAFYLIHAAFKESECGQAPEVTSQISPSFMPDLTRLLVCFSAVCLFFVNIYAKEYLETEYLMNSLMTESEKIQSLNTEQVLQNLNFQTMDGKTIELSSLNGKVVILNFWATWCGPCVGEIPDLNRIQADFANDVIIIGITRESEEIVSNFMTKNKISYKISCGPKNTERVSGIHIFPTTFILDREGKPNQVIRGSRNYEGFKEAVEKAMVSK